MGITLASRIKERAPKSAWIHVERFLKGGVEAFQIDREAKDEGGHVTQRKKHAQGYGG